MTISVELTEKESKRFFAWVNEVSKPNINTMETLYDALNNIERTIAEGQDTCFSYERGGGILISKKANSLRHNHSKK